MCFSSRGKGKRGISNRGVGRQMYPFHTRKMRLFLATVMPGTVVKIVLIFDHRITVVADKFILYFHEIFCCFPANLNINVNKFERAV